jgi:hypothetical protein
MHASAQDLVRFVDARIGQLREGEGGLHAFGNSDDTPGLLGGGSGLLFSVEKPLFQLHYRMLCRLPAW